MGEHWEHEEHGEHGKQQSDDLKYLIYDSLHTLIMTQNNLFVNQPSVLINS